MLDADAIAELLTARFGVPMIGEAADDAGGQRVRFRPSDLPRTQGFTIAVLIGWRAVETEFTPASFGRALLASMELSTPDQRAVFGTFLRAAAIDAAEIRFRINERDADPWKPDKWPAGWNSFILSMQKGPMVIDGGNPAGLQSLAVTWAGRMIGAALSLMPLEPVESAPVGQTEGGGTQVLVTRYERSSINRSACIEIHGALCKACGFDFERFYGEIGRGFIEVHHTQMVARLVPGTILNPETDLVPVCANCHSMLHRRTPPYTVDELRATIHSAAARDSTGTPPNTGPN